MFICFVLTDVMLYHLLKLAMFYNLNVKTVLSDIIEGGMIV